ncbi:MAG TPA: hypothetical protein VLY85_03150 [Thermoplasmata archaeon]|nr:hypothetical protein [Thermoplasmata archaeon]
MRAAAEAPPTATDPGAAREVVRDSRRLFVRIVSTTLPLLLVLVLVLWYAAREEYATPLWTLPVLVAVVFALSSVHAVGILPTYARSVRVDASGIHLAYREFDIEARWADWSPLGYSWITGGVSFRCGRESRRFYVVDPEQARAILQFPGRPDWELSPAMKRLAGPGPSPGGPPA